MQIGIIGLGQLGGSLALSIRQKRHDIRVLGYDIVAAHTQLMQQKEAVDHIYETPEALAAEADIIFLACPLLEYAPIIHAIARQVKPHAIISDVGSVQSVLHAATADYPQLQTIPSHPIAGSEREGPKVARADLFDGRLMLLTPENPKQAGVKKLADFWRSLQVRDVVFMPHELHDIIYAHVSHLPHLLAYAAGNTLHHYGVRAHKDDNTLRQFLRIGKSNPRMWADIAYMNQQALLPALQNARAILEHMAHELSQGAKLQKHQSKQDPAILAKNHLAHLVASSLITCVASLESQHHLNIKPFSGAGLHDTIAPANNTPEEALEIISQHADIVASIIQHYVGALRMLEYMIEMQDHTAILATLTRMQGETIQVLG